MKVPIPRPGAVLARAALSASRWLDDRNARHWRAMPFGATPLGTRADYVRLHDEACRVIYPEVDLLEENTGFAVDRDWLDELALHTQITIKSSALCYAHGRVLYSATRDYLARHGCREITIVETGTARGFSALCMAKALHDAGAGGQVITIDFLPHRTPIFWNCIDDHNGPRSRAELLQQWEELIGRCIFLEGDVHTQIRKVNVARAHVAFVDAGHTYPAVKNEFTAIQKMQAAGDLVIFDDYCSRFAGIVAAVDECCAMFGYGKQIVQASPMRGYAIATRQRE